MYFSVALLPLIMLVSALTPNVGLGEITVGIYLDAPESYRSQATSTVVIGVRNRNDQRPRKQDTVRIDE